MAQRLGRDGTQRRRVRRVVPILTWLPGYDRDWLRGDVAAGIAVTALVVPKNLGYAGIAGVPLQNGLYAAAAGAIIYALFCTSRQISTGPSSSLAAVAGGAVLADRPRRRQAAQLVAAITLASGRPVPSARGVPAWGGSPSSCPKRWSRASWPAPRSTSSSASCPKLTGTSAEGDNAWREFATWLRSLGDVHWTTVLVARRLARGDPRPALPRAGRPRRAGAGRRRAGRLAALRPRRARGRARRTRAARPSGPPRCPTRPGQASTTPRSASRRSRCC